MSPTSQPKLAIDLPLMFPLLSFHPSLYVLVKGAAFWTITVSWLCIYCFFCFESLSFLPLCTLIGWLQLVIQNFVLLLAPLDKFTLIRCYRICSSQRSWNCSLFCFIFTPTDCHYLLHISLSSQIYCELLEGKNAIFYLCICGFGTMILD